MFLPSIKFSQIDMFSGIVREIGIIKESTGTAESRQLVISCSKEFIADCKQGDSVAINGVCLTVTEKQEIKLLFDIASETIRKTTLGALQPGCNVNLETSLTVGDKIDGHFVLGHVDDVIPLLSLHKEGNTICLTFKKPGSVADLITEKGSITLNGVSLTVGKTEKDTFCVYIIPYTFSHTTFADIKPGDVVNCEADSVARYIKSIIEGKS